ncbi:hypothetical protein HDU98_001665 [Podochytrium sp. JEL0797]|nr:hypothetical protein HDU98_001665 [Podochytrium sp. JEL0797]
MSVHTPTTSSQVPLWREDISGVRSEVVVAVHGGKAGWTIADLKRSLRGMTGLAVHKQVILFEDHQLADGVRVSEEELIVVHENGGLTMRKKGQKCSRRRLFAKGIRSFATYITRSFTYPRILREQAELRAVATAAREAEARAAALDSEITSLPTPPTIPSSSQVDREVSNHEAMEHTELLGPVHLGITVAGDMEAVAALHVVGAKRVYDDDDLDAEDEIDLEIEEAMQDVVASGGGKGKQGNCRTRFLS